MPQFMDTISNSEKFLNELLKDFGGIDGALNKLEVYLSSFLKRAFSYSIFNFISL